MRLCMVENAELQYVGMKLVNEGDSFHNWFKIRMRR